MGTRSIPIRLTTQARTAALIRGSVPFVVGAVIFIRLAWVTSGWSYYPIGIEGVLDRYGFVVAGAATVLVLWAVAVSQSRPFLTRKARLEVDKPWVRLYHPGLLKKPMEIPFSDIRSALVDEGGLDAYERFALDESTHLWTAQKGSAFPILSNAPETPNVALLFREFADASVVRRATRVFATGHSATLAIPKKKLGGLLLNVSHPEAARIAFQEEGLDRLVRADDLRFVPTTGQWRAAQARRLMFRVLLLALAGMQFALIWADAVPY